MPKKRKTSSRKICIVTPEFPPDQWGGLARTVGRVAQHCARLGLEVHVAHFIVVESPLVLLDENQAVESDGNITVHHFNVGREQGITAERDLWSCPHTLTLRMMYQCLELLHSAHRFEIFHSFFLYPTGYVTGLLAKRFRVPSIVTLVGNDVKKYLFSPEKVGVCRSGLENAERITAVSRDLVDMANALTPVESKASVIYNSVEIPRKAWELEPSKDGPFRIGCAGIFKYAKGLPYLFKAVAALAADHNVDLDLRGTLRESERQVYEHMIARTGIRDRLQFEGPLPHSGIYPWFRSLNAFVLPSVSEGCPNILMEAMASGVPCVATNTGAVEDLVEDGVSGLVVPWGDSMALTKALGRIANDQRLAQSLGRAARIRMRVFSDRREREDWEVVYRSVIDF